MAAAKLYPGQNHPTSPAQSGDALAVHDVTDFTWTPKAVWNASGTATGFTWIGQDGVACAGYLAAGQAIPIQPKRINSTGIAVGAVLVGLKD